MNYDCFTVNMLSYAELQMGTKHMVLVNFLPWFKSEPLPLEQQLQYIVCQISICEVFETALVNVDG